MQLVNKFHSIFSIYPKPKIQKKFTIDYSPIFLKLYIELIIIIDRILHLASY